MMSLRSLIVLPALIFGLSGLGLVQAEETAPSTGAPGLSLSAIGIAVQKPVPKHEQPNLWWDGDRVGTRVTLLLQNPAGGLLELRDKGRTTAMTDDKGTVLMATPTRRGPAAPPDLAPRPAGLG